MSAEFNHADYTVARHVAGRSRICEPLFDYDPYAYGMIRTALDDVRRGSRQHGSTASGETIIRSADDLTFGYLMQKGVPLYRPQGSPEFISGWRAAAENRYVLGAQVRVGHTFSSRGRILPVQLDILDGNMTEYGPDHRLTVGIGGAAINELWVCAKLGPDEMFDPYRYTPMRVYQQPTQQP